MPVALLDYAARPEFDARGFVVRYLQVLAWVSIAWTALQPFLYRTLIIDPSFIFLFWAASAIERRSALARLGIIGVGIVAVATALAAFAWVAWSGTHGFEVSLGGRRPFHPAPWQVLAALLAIAAILGVPVGVLWLPRWRRQFDRAPT